MSKQLVPQVTPQVYKDVQDFIVAHRFHLPHKILSVH